MKVHGKAACLLLLLVLSASVGTSQQTDQFDEPTYALGNRWEYAVTGGTSGLEGLSNATGTVQVQGLAVAEVRSLEGGRTTLSWTSNLALEGSLSLPIEDSELSVMLEGGISTSREEAYEEGYLLPVAIESLTEFDIQVSGFPLPLEYSATSRLEANNTPGDSFPVYPLKEGDSEVQISTHSESGFRVSFLGTSTEYNSSEDVESTLRLQVTSGHGVVVPAGDFTALKAVLEVQEGRVFSPFLDLFQGTKQVAYYTNEAGNAVLFQFFQGDVEVGNATLRSFSYMPSGGTPLWQHPAFLGGLLLIPAAILIYLYRRERKRGL